MNMLATIVPKSDQLNADDLIGKTLTIEVTEVEMTGNAEQPVAVHFKNDGGKPYKPGKSMRRVLVQIWGPDAAKYVGGRMTLYRDPTVRFGSLDVGGIRISHISGIDEKRTMALTATKGAKKAFSVQPLRGGEKQASSPAPSSDQGEEPWPYLRGGSLAVDKEANAADWLDSCDKIVAGAPQAKALEAWAKAMEPHFQALAARDPETVQQARNLVVDRLDTLSQETGE